MIHSENNPRTNREQGQTNIFTTTNLLPSQQTRGIHPMLFQYWSTVFDAGPTLKQHWANAPCLLPRAFRIAQATLGGLRLRFTISGCPRTRSFLIKSRSIMEILCWKQIRCYLVFFKLSGIFSSTNSAAILDSRICQVEVAIKTRTKIIIFLC